MHRKIVAGAIYCVAIVLAAGTVHAADVCPALRLQSASPDPATRIAAFACNENLLWYRPFIDANGRVASTTVAEAESSLLADHATETWQRVADYWRQSGLLPQMSRFPGAEACALAGHDIASAPACRAFVIDHPWSAVFVSYVMSKAFVPGFRPSATHFDYVRDALLHPDISPFLYLDPSTAKPATGDLLCAVRGGPGRGYPGLVASIDGGGGSLNMHCDIVVGVNPGGDGKVYLIGGNVQQGVTMRLLNVNRLGNFWGLPQRSGTSSECSPDNIASCNFNRQDWAVLLKLKAPAALAQLTPAVPSSPQPATPEQPQKCCIYCVLGSPVPRCPNPGVATPP